jgi:drug/metabolite transporter (DMT)-like permease
MNTPPLRGAGRGLTQALWSTPALLLVLATLFWSANFVLGRALHAHIPPIGLSFWRWSLAFAIVLGFAWPHLRRDAAALRARWPLVMVLALLGVASFNALVYYGLNTTTVVNAVLLQSTMPVLIILGSLLIYGERVRLLQLLALAISLLGVAAIVARGDLHTLTTLSITPGDAWIFLAVVGYALYSVLLRDRPVVHPLSFCAATFLLGALMLLPLYVYETLAVRAMRWDAITLTAVAYVGVFPSLLAYLCFNRAVELAGANRAGQFVHLMPVFGSALAAIFLGERLQGYHLVGALLIATGIVLNQRARR